MAKNKRTKTERIGKQKRVKKLALNRFWSKEQLFDSHTHRLKKHIRSMAEARQVLNETVKLAIQDGKGLWLSNDERKCLSAIGIQNKSDESMLYKASVANGCVWVSEAWCTFTGAPPQAHLGDGWKRFIHSAEKIDSISATNASRSQANRQIYKVKRHDGVYRWVIDIRLGKNDPQGMVHGIVIDIDDAMAFLSAHMDASLVSEAIKSFPRHPGH